MSRTRHTEEEIIAVLKRVEVGRVVVRVRGWALGRDYR